MAQCASCFMALLDWCEIGHDPSYSRNMDFFMADRIDCASASPDGFNAFAGVRAAVEKSDLPKQLFDLVYLRVSQMNCSALYVDVHSRSLLELGLTVEKLGQVPIWRNAGHLFNARERSALAWAETVTRVAETGVPDSDYEAAAVEFNNKELADLTYAIALMNALNRIGMAFRSTLSGKA